MIWARCSRSPGQVFGEDVVDNVVALNAERFPNKLGGMIAVVRIDCLLKQIGNGVYSSLMT